MRSRLAQTRPAAAAAVLIFASLMAAPSARADDAAAPAAPATEPAVGEIKPLFAYVGAFNQVVAGGLADRGTYVHALATGALVPLTSHWSATVQAAWTAGRSVSAKAIGDIAGVQGPFNTGDGLWLYELKATYTSETSTFNIGRVSTGDPIPGAAGMLQFENSAFSSSGGAITINDPGRATTPASTWGAWGKTMAGPIELRAGAFLSDPKRTALNKHGVDFSFRPSDGVIAFGEAVAPLAAGLRAGIGGYTDSADFKTFAGRPVKGDDGWYLWLERPAPDKPGPALSGFAMIQVAPQDDRNLQPTFLIGGVTWQGLMASRPSDALSLGATTGEFSKRSTLRGWETALETNYRIQMNDHLILRPDLQYVISPSGKTGGPNALVLGFQVEVTL